MFMLPLALLAAQSAGPAPTPPAGAVFMFETGGSLLAKCRNRAPEYKLACTAYVVGAIDGIKRQAFLGYPLNHCWPAQISAQDATRIVVTWLDRNVSEHGAPASVLIAVALNDRFPCG